MSTFKFFGFGNVVRKPEVKVLPSGTSVAKFAVAHNEYYKGRDGQRKTTAHYFDIEVWGGLADFAGKYLDKGRLVAVEGSPKQERWRGNNGNRSRVVFRATSVQLLDKRNNRQQEESYDESEDAVFEGEEALYDSAEEFETEPVSPVTIPPAPPVSKTAPTPATVQVQASKTESEEPAWFTGIDEQAPF